MSELPRHLWSLVKPRIVALLCLTGVTALYAAGGAAPPTVAGFVVSGALIAAAAAAANCWYDRDLDRHMERTADRPLPSGDLDHRVALAFVAVLFVAGSLVGLATLPVVAVGYSWLGAASYVGLYTIGLKRRHWLGVVLGGSAGSFPVLAGWTVVEPVGPVAVAMAALVFAWTPAHAWALAYVYRDDFAAADVPTLPAVADARTVRRAVWYAALSTVAVAAVVAVYAGPVYRVAAAAGTVPFLLAFYGFYRAGTEPAAVRAFFTSNTYLAVLFLAWAGEAAVGSLGPGGAAAVALAAVGLHGWVWRVRPSLRGVEAGPPPHCDRAATGARRFLASVVGLVR
jgi:protoheme IX farnesyltransferase